MLPSVSAVHSASRARASDSSALSRCNITMGASRKGVNCLPEVPTAAVEQHILQHLAEAYPRALTALELAKSFGDYKIKSRVNSVLHRELSQAGLVEKDPAANVAVTGSKPAWRLTAQAVTASALDPGSSAAATGVGATVSAVQHQQPCQPRSTNSAALYHTNTPAVAAVAGQPAHHSGAPRPSAEQADYMPTRTSVPGSSRRMVVGAATCSISTAHASRCRAAAEPGSSSHNNHLCSSFEDLLAALDYLWNDSAAVSAIRMQGPGTSHTYQARLPPQMQSSDSLTLQQNPVDFKQHFQDAFYRRVHPAPQELQAAKDSINNIAQRLQQSAMNQHALKLNNQPVTIDRVCIAGSVGKGTCVSGSFDVDIVLFVNLSPEYLQMVNVMDPDSTHNDDWMQDLYEQLERCLTDLPQLVKVKRGTSAVSCQLVAGGAHRNYPPMYVNVDLLLAPNLAGAVADDCKAAAQRAAVLLPLLAVGDAVMACNETTCARPSAGSSANTGAHRDQSPVMPKASYARAIWLQESTTHYVSAVAATLEAHSCTATSGSTSKVVSNTMTLTKAWIMRGLQQGERVAEYKQMKGFMIELLVLKAADRWYQLLPQQQQESSPATSGRSSSGAATASTGRHMLDLFLLVLEEAQQWADIAESNKCVSRTNGNLRPILYTDVPCKDSNGQQVSYYTEQQAWALQKAVSRFAPGQDWTRGEQCFAQPVVVNPIDPLDNIFSHRRLILPMWHVFKADAATLYQELCTESWGYIMTESSLAAVLGIVSHG